MKKLIAALAIAVASAVGFAVPARADTQVPVRYYYGYSRAGSISYSANPYAYVTLPPGQDVTVSGPGGLWWLPQVPTKATGCYSLAGAKLPNGSHAPATWYNCSTGVHEFVFPVPLP